MKPRSLVDCEIAALPLAAFRVGCGLLYVSYFATQIWWMWPLRGLLPSSRAGQTLAWVALIGGVGAALTLSLGRTPVRSALGLLACCTCLDRVLPGVRYFDDDIARVLSFWLALLPLGPAAFAGPSARRSTHAPSATWRLFLITAALLPLLAAQSQALVQGFPLHVQEAWGIAAAPLLALLGRFRVMRWPALFAHLGGLLVVLPRLGLPFTAASMLLVAPLFHFTRSSTEPAVPRFDTATAIAATYVATLLLWSLGALPPFAATGRAATRLLADTGLWLHAPTPGLWEMLASAPLRLRGGSSTDQRPPFGITEKVRGRLLLRPLDPASSQPRDPAAQQCAHTFVRAIAERYCAEHPHLKGTLTLARDAETPPWARFTCKGGAGVQFFPREGADEPLQPGARDFLANVSQRFPEQPETDAYAGSQPCAECHPEHAQRWLASPHARGRAQAGAANVVGDFSGSPVAMPRSSITPGRDDRGLYMELASNKERLRLSVDRVLGAGGRSQAYLHVEDNGHELLLPLIWLSTERRWLPLGLLFPSIDPRDEVSGQLADAEEQACSRCHAGEARSIFGPAGFRQQVVDTAVGCESCHGPRASHVRAPNAPPNQVQSSAARAESSCERCHGRHGSFWAPDAEGAGTVDFAMALDDPSVRADGTPVLASGLELAAFSLSRCKLEGGAHCTSCHDPHGQALRPEHTTHAEGSNAVCVQCHHPLAAGQAATAHSHHPAAVLCVDCHMPTSFIRDDPRAGRAGTNHGISIPRPRESIELRLPNACANCHREREPTFLLQALVAWRQHQALDVRPIMRTIARAKAGATDQADELAVVLTGRNAPPLLLASVLRFLANQTADADLLPMLAPFAQHSVPEVRAAALAALAVHDAAHARDWQAKGSADAHPFVRLMSFELGAALGSLSEVDKQRYLLDLIGYSTRPPVIELLGLARLREASAEPEEALTLVELALRYSSTWQRTCLGLDAEVRRLRQVWGLGHNPSQTL